MPAGLSTIGTLVLDGITFTTDPRVYEPRNWPKRVSVHRGLNGSVTVQDFGLFAKDNRIRIESGDQYLSTAVVDALQARYQTPGATYTLTDWLGNEFTVFILDFRPVEAQLGGAWRYSMDLVVLGIAQLNGVPYTGS